MGVAGRKQGRGDVSDAQWAMIVPLLPEQKRGGRWNDHRVTFDGMLWVMRTGAPWRDLPERYGKWQSVYHRFNRWRKDGTIDKVLKALRIRLDKNGHIDWDLWCVDGTSVRASRSAAGASKKAKNQAADTGTTRWATRVADGDQSSTWSLTVTAFPSPPSSRRDRTTRADRSSS
jgi:transposase